MKELGAHGNTTVYGLVIKEFLKGHQKNFTQEENLILDQIKNFIDDYIDKNDQKMMLFLGQCINLFNVADTNTEHLMKVRFSPRTGNTSSKS